MPAPLLTREELLNRLSESFRRHGYEGASMSRIAAATGMGKASLYHHFPEGKEQMAAAVIDHGRDWFEKNIFRGLETTHPPRQRLTAMLETLGRHFEGGTLCCLPGLFALGEERDMFAPAIRDFFQRWVACLTQVCIDAGLAQHIATRRAYAGVERVQGALVLARALGDPNVFAATTGELPEQMLAGGDRANIWSTRTARLPSAPTPLHLRPLRA